MFNPPPLIVLEALEINPPWRLERPTAKKVEEALRLPEILREDAMLEEALEINPE